jgi:hypothetical protein
VAQLCFPEHLAGLKSSLRKVRQRLNSGMRRAVPINPFGEGMLCLPSKLEQLESVYLSLFLSLSLSLLLSLFLFFSLPLSLSLPMLTVIRSLAKVSDDAWKAWFELVQQDRPFLLFAQLLREVLKELFANEQHDDDDDEELVEAQRQAGAARAPRLGPARRRLLTFERQPSEETLEAAVERHEQVPAAGVIACAHLLPLYRA